MLACRDISVSGLGVSIVLLVAFLLAPASASAQDVTGLNGWDLYLAPGHNRFENKGAFGYSEAQKTLRVGLELRELLHERTDIDSVYIARKTDNVTVSLRQRVNAANRLGVSHFHAIHSNAAGNPSARSLFVLWPQYKNGEEAEPNGGKRMSEIMAPIVANGMRVPLFRGGDGAVGECDFYGVASCRERNIGAGKGGSRNFVQSFTSMPSELSESSYHTNPRQNQLFMNADYKHLQARAMFWSILEYHGAGRPDVQTLTGTVRNVETGRPLNGVTVSVADTSYTTDTYESLFNEYSNRPGRLRNGFYYLDDLPERDSLTVTIEKEGFETKTTTVAMKDDFFTFFDTNLISSVPPRVAETRPAPEDTLSILDNIRIEFSRQMDTASVRRAFSIEPSTGGDFRWSGNRFNLTFAPDTLMPLTDYTVRIGGSAEGAYDDPLDGNADGTGGDAFSLSFTTGPPDARPPQIVASDPTPGATVEGEPIISMTFNERLDPASVTPERFRLAPTGGGDPVPGEINYHAIGEQSVVSFFPADSLQADKFYRITIESGLRDETGNEWEGTSYAFRTEEHGLRTTLIDDFDDGPNGWFGGPAQSGSTIGVVPDSTSAATTSAITNRLTASAQSYRIDYGWNESADGWLIRQYLQSGPPKNVDITADDMLQAYVFGDGSGNQVRFVIEEGGDGGFEASPWRTVDWIGWRLVSWDLSEEAVAWVNGNGTVEGNAQLDSFQLTHPGPDAATYGQLYFDDLRTARRAGPVANEPTDALPTRHALHAPYPNPVRSRATFRLELPVPSNVTVTIYDALGRRVATLAEDRRLSPGTHELRWDAGSRAAGVYFARMRAGEASRTARFVVVR
jgi:N-acetylmuramoyl-L-alanine amidase